MFQKTGYYMNNKTKKNFFRCMAIFTVMYIIWRMFFTLPFNHGYIALFVGALVLLLEIWDALDFFIHYFNILMGKKIEIKNKVVSKKIVYPNIDILIATYNEEKTILEKTINGCLNLKYPKKNKIHIYVCDDGNREDIRKLATEMNVNYITRSGRINAKAGNYNNALNKISSPYIVTLDADMIPMDDFLITTINCFLSTNEKLGYVQLPQSFYNQDIYAKRFNLKTKIPYEQQFFYEELQLYKNNLNATIYCGTNTMFLRQALDDVNGFALDTLSEDIATGMLIQNKGYKGLALPYTKAIGYSVDDLTGFIKQRSRWARGCIQMLKKYKIFTLKGLNIKQKLEYFTCVSFWMFGLKRLLYLLIPILFVVFGITIIDCKFEVFFIIWFPMYVMKRFALDIIFEHKRSATWNKIYETILTPILAFQVLVELIGIKKTNFEVSPKKNNNKDLTAKLMLLIPHILLLGINLYAFFVCISNINYNSKIFFFSLLWLMSNIFYLTIAVIFDIGRKNEKEIDIYAECKCKIKQNNSIINCYTKRIDESLILIKSKKQLDVNGVYEIEICQNGYISKFIGTVDKQLINNEYILNVTDLTKENRLILYQIMYNRQPQRINKYNTKSLLNIFIN